MSVKNSRGVTLFHVIRKYMLSPKDSENRDVLIIYQESILGKFFTRDATKIIGILKELTLGTDVDKYIQGLK